MKIQPISDLHLEHGKNDELYERMCACEADVLVLAGDISSNDYVIQHLNEIQEYTGKRIIFVPGNHSYYGTSRKEFDKELRLVNDINSKIHVLLESDITIGGVCFMGTTGWWDGSNGTIGMSVKNGLSDFRMIYDLMDEENLDGVVWGRKAKTYLNSKMHWMRHNLPNTKICVVTHHYPHYRSLDPRFAGSPLNVCFGNRWEQLIEDYRPELWIHGHTHSSFDYTVGSHDGHPHLREEGDDKRTRIICNPQGYPQEFAAPKGSIEDYYANNGMELTVADMNIYQTTENIHGYNPEMIVEL